jgi:glutamine synthetase
MVKSKDRATSSVASRRAVLKKLRDENVEHVLFWFTDLEGHLKSFAITPAEMEARSTTGWASTARRSPASIGSRSRT